MRKYKRLIGVAKMQGNKMCFDAASWAALLKASRKAHQSIRNVVIAALKRGMKYGKKA